MSTQLPTVDLDALAERVREAVAEHDESVRVNRYAVDPTIYVEGEGWFVWRQPNGIVNLRGLDETVSYTPVTPAALAALRVLMGERDT